MEQEKTKYRIEDFLKFFPDAYINEKLSEPFHTVYQAICPECGRAPHHFRIWDNYGYAYCYCVCCKHNTEEVVAFLNSGNRATPLVSNDASKVHHGKIIEDITYEYCDLYGNVQYYKNRKKYEDGHKIFAFYHYEEQWEGHLVSRKKVLKKPTNAVSLYRLDKLKKALDMGRNEETLFIVEGEKCVNAMEDNAAVFSFNDDVLVTSGCSGANSKITEAEREILRQFSNKVLFMDNDKAGEEYASAFHDVGPIKIIKMKELWNDCPKGGDIADYLECYKGENNIV